MSEGNRFWSPRMRNYVITRERGDIPGCVLAVDVFVEDDEGKITVQNKSVPIGHNYYMS